MEPYEKKTIGYTNQSLEYPGEANCVFTLMISELSIHKVKILFTLKTFDMSECATSAL